MIEKEKAVEIANKFFEEKNKTQIVKLLETSKCWICYGGPADKMIVGKSGIKIDKQSGEISNFILPNRENFALLKEAEEIQI